MAEAKNIDWEGLRAKLPYEKTDEQKVKRKALFKQFDCNGNGHLSLAETEKAIRDVLGSDAMFDAKPAIIRAFNFAKGVSPDGGKLGPDLIEFREFRLFLQTLRQYFEYYQAFARVDTSDDKRISLAEFKEGQSMTEKWVGKIDAEKEFKVIDKNGGGQILFDEFVEWALKKNLDLEDDDE